MHKSAYEVIITFGKYKGFSLGYIYDLDKNYLTWLSSSSIPSPWDVAASLVLEKKDISHLFSPSATKVTYITAEVVYVDAHTLRVSFGYNKELLARFKYEVDGRKWNAEEKAWDVPAEQILKVVTLFGGPANVKTDDATKRIWKREKKRREDLDIIRDKTETEFEAPLKLPLFPYQQVAVEFVDRAGGRAMVADQMGLGKTVVAVGYATLHKFKTIIICPKSVVPHWVREIKRFTGKTAVVWTGQGRLGRSDAHFHVMNYDIVGKHIPELNKLGFDLMVCDEATYLKNRRTKRAKSILGSLKEKRKFPGVKSKHCIFLTGTPVLNRPVEAFHLLNYLDKNRFNNFYHFVQKYGGWKGAEAKNLEDLHDRTKDLIIRRRKKDVWAEMPDKQRNDLYVEMTDIDVREYNTHLDKLFRKWRQLGKPTVAEMPAIQKFLIQKKMPRAMEMIDELVESGRSVLVFSVYIDPLKQLKEHYGDNAALVYGQMSSAERQDSINKLSSGEAKVGVFSLGAGSMGIDGLQKQIDTVIFLDHWWVPAVHEQAEDRVHRIGQDNKVQIFYMICENTIDEYMRQILVDKQLIIDTVVDGRLVSIARDKSFFKEFVQILQRNFNDDIKIDYSRLINDDTVKIPD